VHAASFSPDGTRVVTASDDGTARLWDSKSGASLATFSDHLGNVYAATFSPNGDRIVTAGEDGRAFIYSTKLDYYVTHACELLSGHPAEFQDVADVCKLVGVLPLNPAAAEAPAPDAKASGKSG
jgi:WD40 repeat protein